MNDICKITKYYKNDCKKIISCSIFPMKTSYRDFNKYITGLDNTINRFKKNLPDFKLRLYYDSKIKDIIHNKYNNNSYVQLAEYECLKFKKDGFHIGIFGMFIRFIPLFKNDENLEIVVISDIDLMNHEADFFSHYYQAFSKINLDLSFVNIIAYKYRYNKEFIIPEVGNVAISQICIRNPSYDIKIMIDFLEDLMKNNKYEHIVKKLYNLRKEKTQGISFDHSYPIIYGIDEYFINRFIIERYINDKKNVKCLVNRDLMIKDLFRSLYEKINKTMPDDINKINISYSKNEFIQNSKKFKERRDELIKIIETDEKIYQNFRYNDYYINLKKQPYYFRSRVDKIYFHEDDYKYIFYDANYLTTEIIKEY
jgi:hypothetical protein